MAPHTALHFPSFFFLMIRRPPSSPLFPYPTLFRSLRTAPSTSPAHSSSRSARDNPWPRSARAHSSARLSMSRSRSAARRRAFRMRSARREGIRLLPDELSHGVEQVRLEPAGRRALVDGHGAELAAPALPVHVGAHLRVDLDLRVGAVGLDGEG